MWVCTRCILRKWGFSSEDILEPGLRAACLSKAESGRGRQQRAGQRRCCVNCKVLLLLLASRGRSSLWNHTQWPSFFLSSFHIFWVAVELLLYCSIYSFLFLIQQGFDMRIRLRICWRHHSVYTGLKLLQYSVTIPWNSSLAGKLTTIDVWSLHYPRQLSVYRSSWVRRLKQCKFGLKDGFVGWGYS